jgi:Bacterial Ig-like domain (group 3)
MFKQAWRFIFNFGLALIVLLACSGVARAQWQEVNGSAAPFSAGTCLLLTDGTVMCQQSQTNHWHRLTPDSNGSYVNGTWSNLADTPDGTDSSNVGGATCAPCAYAPLYFASAVLADGRVVVIGGEYNTNGYTTSPATSTDTNIGFLFDPTGNGGAGSWSTAITVPSTWTQVGDSPSVILPDKTLLLGDSTTSGHSSELASFAPGTLTFSLVNASGKADANSEEGWVLLPKGTVLTVDTQNGTNSEIYDPSTLTWSSAGSTIVSLPSNTGNPTLVPEMGPLVLRPDGTVFAFGASGHNAVYTISSGTWAAAQDFPVVSGNQFDVADGPASLLPDGNVLVAASPLLFMKPTRFYETDGTTTSAPTQVTSTPNAANVSSFQVTMLLLPTGQVLVTDQSSDVEIYTPSGTYQSAWQPTISSLSSNLGKGQTYPISGTQFNGLSQASSYGDDAQMATNYPLIRITNTGSGHVLYARTHDHSTMGVATGSATVSTEFDVPSSAELGPSTLVVVANGIPSAAANINIGLGTSLAITGATSAEFDDPAIVAATLTSGGNPIASETVTLNLVGGPSCSALTNASGVASCSLTPNEPAGIITLTATFGGDSTYGASSASTPFTVLLEETALAFTSSSAITSDFHDAAIVQAVLSSDGGTTAIGSELVTFTLGSGLGAPTCSGITNSAGLVSCSITPNEMAGTYTLNVSFAGDPFYAASSAGTPFTVTKEETTVKFTSASPTVIANGHSTTFSATLLEDGITPISGRNLTITIGTQSCITGTTDATGTASCTILISQVLGPDTVKANFAGDGFYLPSATSETVIVFAFLNSGSMIIGNLDSAVATVATFWGAQWAKLNSLTGGPAPNSFKGFADVAPQACGGSWTSSPGNSSGSPSGPLPSYMGVIVSSVVGQSGSMIAGDVPEIVVVKTNAGYAPNPGHAGTGTVVAVFCVH